MVGGRRASRPRRAFSEAVRSVSRARRGARMARVAPERGLWIESPPARPDGCGLCSKGRAAPPPPWFPPLDPPFRGAPTK